MRIHPERRVWLALGLMLPAAGCIVGLRHLGLWLELNEGVQRSRAIVVLGGGFPYRATEAARLFKAGWAPEIWLTQGSRDDRDRTLAEFGIPAPYGRESGRWLLLHLGVPAAAVRLVPGEVSNTRSELEAVVRYARHEPLGTLMLVTSRAHARRVKTIWNPLSSQPCVVRHGSEERYTPAAWWRDREDVVVTFRETFGILKAWAWAP